MPSYPLYDPAFDAPATSVYAPLNLRATLAAQDRDLIAEARDTDACLEAAGESLSALYPGVVLCSTVPAIPTIQN